MRQKLQFIATILHQPELIILDEPFSGLDPVNADMMKDIILELQQKGATIIFSTHDMAMAERMCDYIFMIYQGKEGAGRNPGKYPGSVWQRYPADSVRYWEPKL